ncbi:asparagine synthase-related protein [Streptomyces sp. UNOC14_S4]|uniref:asparagine synthase-related protein n=1 Tax=Streptomyces sp. UNOC14_S4 TaxID=2872340 RepID=UPI001E3DC4FE|nr:asparagine synthase-related protein [Streptomyces sp. UNOC14_S4]MCC3770363.1 hypothetical protein [Streptomyces sp. UNOC14_S4]
MTGEAWFAVLPDGEAGLTAARALRPLAANAIEHASGRSWLLGNWPEGHVKVARTGAARMAVIGRCPVTARALTARLGLAHDIDDAERAVQGLPGSFHAVVSLGRRVRVRGSASGARRVFYARVGDTTVAADRADTLASLTGAGIDEQQLALHLLSSPPLHPLDDACVWGGVQALRPHDALLIDPDGRARTCRWWQSPEPVLTLADGVPGVRRALETAVRSCAAGGGTISSDLSGGMDSTSLCFLAARDGAQLITFRWESQDPGNDDPAWGAQAASWLPGADHVAVGRTEIPPWYTGLADTTVPTAEPGAWVRDTARLAAMTHLMTDRGSRLHMTGGGGDELFTAFSSHLYDYVRSRPLAALARLHRQCAFRRTRLWPAVRGLADRRTYAQWLAAQADGLTSAPPLARRELAAFSVAWGVGLRMPS